MKSCEELVRSSGRFVQRTSGVVLLFVVTRCSPVTTNAPRPEPCANPVIVVQNNIPYRVEIFQYQNTRPTFIGLVGALNKQTIPVEGKRGYYFAAREDGRRVTARDAVRIDRHCPKE
jgi:hypothetical protein